MINKIGGRIWWWAVPVVVVLGGAGYWYSQTRTKPENVLVSGDLSPVDKTASSQGVPGPKDLEQKGSGAGDIAERPARGKSFPIDEKAVPKKPLRPEIVLVEKEVLLQELRSATEGQIEQLLELDKKDFADIDKQISHLFEPGKDDSTRTVGQVTRLFEPRQDDVFGKAPAEKIYCTLIDEYTADFFGYLDTKKYIERLHLKTDTYACFKTIIKRLTAQPPVPAGEGFATTTMVKNVFFFSRALNRKDLLFVKEVVTKEHDTLEINLEMFYRWLMLGNFCPNPGNVRPPFDVIYRYAGFFLNTTGGRSYLFRRSVTLRLLLTYYSLLIVHQADRSGKNSYGINIFPYIQPLKDEIRHYPDLEFQNQYVRALIRIEDYYLQKR